MKTNNKNGRALLTSMGTSIKVLIDIFLLVPIKALKLCFIWKNKVEQQLSKF